MLDFKLTINNTEFDIIEPIGFDGVDFQLIRDKDLHSINQESAGNKVDFEFQKDIHYNIINQLFDEYNTKGFNGVASIKVLYNSNIWFSGDCDFSTVDTDLVTYFKCQFLKRDKLYYLEKNKDIAVDLNAATYVDEDTNEPLLPIALKELYIEPLELVKTSIFEDTQELAYPTLGIFNNIRNNTTYEINDTLNWLDINEEDSDGAKRRKQLISAKENLNDISIKFEFASGTQFKSIANPSTITLMLLYGDERPDLSADGDGDWYNQTTKQVVYTASVLADQTISIPNEFNFNIDNLPRGGGIWVYWEINKSFGTNAIFYNKNSKITIVGTAKTYGSLTKGANYVDCVKDLVKKSANINNVQFNIQDYNENIAFNVNLLRNLTDQSFNIKWNDVKKQLKERDYGAKYDELTDTLVIDKRDAFFTDNRIIDIVDFQRKDKFKISEDSQFIINQFNYKYSKYQSLNENEVSGNRSSVHGNTEWELVNKGYEGSISVDLSFIRDSFMIQEVRNKANDLKNDTSTNNDDTIFLIDSTLETGVTFQEEVFYMSASFSDGVQTFANNGEYSFLNLGIKPLQTVTINNTSDFRVTEVDRYTLTLEPLSGASIFNGIGNYKIKYFINGGTYFAIKTNGLFNGNFSVRQNIKHWQKTLSICSYYTKNSYVNRVYNEDATARINNLVERTKIKYVEPLHTPRIIEGQLKISVDEFTAIKNNPNGYIEMYNAKDETIKIFIQEVSAKFLNGCNEMEVDISGWLKNDAIQPVYPIIDYQLTIGKNIINGIVYQNLTFEFDDDNETVTFFENENIIYNEVYYSYCCGLEYCYATYNQVKNYLLSL